MKDRGELKKIIQKMNIIILFAIVDIYDDAEEQEGESL